jgi:hypothetical protein
MKSHEPIQISDCEGKKSSASLAILKGHIVTSNETARKKRVQNLLDGLDELFAYDDPLTLLILENTVIDILHSKLKIHLTQGNAIHAGVFSILSRGIEINDVSELQYDSATMDANILLHEMTHAVACFGFRIDPFALQQFFKVAGYGDSFGAKITVEAELKEFIKNHHLPYPSQPNSRFFNFMGKLHSDDRKKFRELNPARHKFDYCVREDVARITKQNYFNFPEDERFNDLAWNLQSCMYNPNRPAELGEVFSRYMECRLHLLRKAKENAIPENETFKLLEKISPKVHAYFETDVKKILHLRLIYFTEKYPNDFKSVYFKKYPKQESTSVHETYRRDGTLKFKK